MGDLDRAQEGRGSRGAGLGVVVGWDVEVGLRGKVRVEDVGLVHITDVVLAVLDQARNWRLVTLVQDLVEPGPKFLGVRGGGNASATREVCTDLAAVMALRWAMRAAL